MGTLKIKAFDSFNNECTILSLEDSLPLSYSQFVELFRSHHVQVSSYVDGILCTIDYSFIYL